MREIRKKRAVAVEVRRERKWLMGKETGGVVS